MEFTDYQIDFLYEIAEVHFEWYNIYNPGSKIKFEDVLELNHIKLSNIIEACDDCTNEMINDIFESVYNNYIEMLRDIKS
jgi:hypothetical protein